MMIKNLYYEMKDKSKINSKYCFRLFFVWDPDENISRMRWVPNKYKTQQICNETVEEDPCIFQLVPDQYNVQEMFYEAVKEEFKILQYVPGHIIAKKTSWKGC